MQGGFNVCDCYCFAHSASHHIASHSRYTHQRCVNFWNTTRFGIHFLRWLRKMKSIKYTQQDLSYQLRAKKVLGDVKCECECVRGFLAGFCHNTWNFWFCMRVTVFHPSNMSLWFFFCLPNSLPFSPYPSRSPFVCLSVSLFSSRLSSNNVCFHRMCVCVCVYLCVFIYSFSGFYSLKCVCFFSSLIG